MGKILFWGLVILGGLIAARLLAAHSRKQNSKPDVADTPQASNQTTSSVKADIQPEAMVRCAHCGIHMPRSEAVLTDGQTWCSPEHARLGVRP